MRFRKYPEGEWQFKWIFEPGELLRFIRFGLLRLKREERWRFSTESNECVLLLLSGMTRVFFDGKEEVLGPRKSVFESKAHALYVSMGTDVSVEGVYQSEMAIACAKAVEKHPPRVLRPEDVRVRIVGEMNWRRHVHDIVVDNVEADRLLVGETFNPPGNWSSYPPHRHDVDDIPNESNLEEIYHYRVSPSWGFGAQFLYTDDGDVDEVFKIENGATMAIDKGYHPVVAAPGYQVYYLWVLAGEKRILIPRDDPKHSWIKAMEASVRNW